MKFALFVILIILSSYDANAACSNDSSCAIGQFCRMGNCVYGKKCTSKDDCPLQGSCVGYYSEPYCIDFPSYSGCNACLLKGNVTEPTPEIPDIVVFNTFRYDGKCLKATSIGGYISGICKFDQLTRSLCFFAAFQSKTMGFFIGIGFIISIGFTFLTGKGNTSDAMVKIITIIISLSFITGGAMLALVSMVSKQELAKCPTYKGLFIPTTIRN